jgi:enterochelin esterase-like enzyme
MTRSRPLLAALLLGAAAPSHALQGTLVTPVTFTGPVTGRTIVFSLYLPPGYAGGSTRYAAVYHLHGKDSAHDSTLRSVAQSHEDAVAAGRIGPVIIVFPDGTKDSFWADSTDGSRRIETSVVSEVLPYVDAQYRTLADRASRAAQGFSMGGFGAARLASKFPHLFCAGLVYDGALVTWSRLVQYHPTVATSMFGDSESDFDQYSPWHWVSQNAATLRTDVRFRQVVGTEVTSNRDFRAHLEANGLTPEYVETGCGHQITCVLGSGGADSWAFLARAFGSAVPTPTATVRPTARPTGRPTPPRFRPRPTPRPR